MPWFHPSTSLRSLRALPQEAQRDILYKRLRFYVIDAHKVARDLGMADRINTIMQTCFFALSGVLPREQAIAQIKQRIKKTYGKRGEAVVQKNYQAVDETLAHLYEVHLPRIVDEPEEASGVQKAAQVRKQRALLPVIQRRPSVPAEAPDFVRDVLGPMIIGQGDKLPVSALPQDRTYPSGTARWEKRWSQMPIWIICIESNRRSRCQ